MNDRNRLLELASVFATLGVIGFGGPAAHIALMRREVVQRRNWLTDEQFIDLVGVTNLIPGPNSTEMAMHVGRVRAGLPGLLVAGVAFIVPAASIVAALAWVYTAYGRTPEAAAVLYGVKPVIIVIIISAIWALGRVALARPLPVAVAVAVLAAALVGVNEVALLAVGALAVATVRGTLGRGGAGRITRGLVAIPFAAAASVVTETSLAVMALTFLKIGSVLYGSGYVLVSFLRDDFVHNLGWLTDAQLLDAVAIGQVTPGPLFTTATFIGFILVGVPGALLATVAIFLPGFVFVAILSRWVDRVRSRPITAALLDGVNAAALGLMAAVTVGLAGEAVFDPATALIGAAAILAVPILKYPSVLVVGAAGAIGLILQAAGIVSI